MLLDAGLEEQHATLNQLLRTADRTWHGVKLGQPDWSVTSHSLAVSAEARKENLLLHMILNAYWEPLEFELPATNGDIWHLVIDTGLDSPDDIREWHSARPITDRTYRAAPRSVVTLYSRL
jgi:glycogen operon protein